MPAEFVVARSESLPGEVARILRGLPEWFGIEQSLREYVEDARRLPTYAARVADGGAVVGVLLAKRHFPAAAEVHLMAVDRAWHRRGVGRALIRVAEEELRADGVQFLQVKTLSGSRADENYEKTRLFYLAEHFVPLEEFPELWNSANPCLLLVKSLATR
jgi:GNAT superfamily N-acetyltransferase